MSTDTDTQEFAETLFSSIRGQYIIGQALYLAIEAIEARPPELQEPSNVADMRALMDHLFPIFAATQSGFLKEAQEVLLKDMSTE